MAIDVGAPCIDGDTSDGWAGYTIVSDQNAANDIGTIDYICIWWNQDPADAEAGAFSESSNDLTCVAGAHVALPDRGVGEQEYNAPTDFTAFNINTGEYIGIYFSAGAEEAQNIDPDPGGCWYLSGDQLPCDAATFSEYRTLRLYSIYATGTEGNGAVAPTGALYGPLVGPLGGPI